MMSENKAEQRKVSASREDNAAYMNKVLPVQESFDVIQRDMLIGGRMSSFYFIDGFTKDEVMLKIMDSMMKVKEEEMPADAAQFTRTCVPYVEVEVLEDYDAVLRGVLSGVTCLFIDGYEAVSPLTAGHIRRGVWMSRLRTSLFGDQETGLWRPLYLIRH